MKTTRQRLVLPQSRPTFPRGWSHRKPELPYQHYSKSKGPCRQLSSWQWALSEVLSVSLADIDWKYESALAQRRHLRSVRGIHCSVENRKCLSPLHRLPHSRWCFRRSGCCTWLRFSWRRWGDPAAAFRRRAGRCSAEAGHIGNQGFHISTIQGQGDHAGSFHLGGGRFQKCCQFRWRILTGNMSQRWPNAATSALSVASTAALRIEKAFPVCIACRTSRWCFRRSGCCTWLRFSWRRRGPGRWCRRRAGRCSPEAGQVGDQSFHFSAIQSQGDHAGSFHLGGGRFQKCCQLSWRILTGNMSQRRPNGPTSALSVASTAAVRIENALPLADVASSEVDATPPVGDEAEYG